MYHTATVLINVNWEFLNNSHPFLATKRHYSKPISICKGHFNCMGHFNCSLRLRTLRKQARILHLAIFFRFMTTHYDGTLQKYRTQQMTVIDYYMWNRTNDSMKQRNSNDDSDRWLWNTTDDNDRWHRTVTKKWLQMTHDSWDGTMNVDRWHMTLNDDSRRGTMTWTITRNNGTKQ